MNPTSQIPPSRPRPRSPQRGTGPRFALAILALVLAIGAVPATAAKGPAKKQRVVALSPFAANTLAKLGVRPAAVGQTVGGESRFSPRLRGVPVLPLSHPNGPNLEQLARLDPDLVLSSPAWAKGAAAMGSLGIRVVDAEPSRVASAYKQMTRIGALVGRAERARALVKSTRRQIAQATRKISSRPRVMMILGVGRTPYIFLPNSWGADIVRLAGGTLVTGGATASGGFAQVSDELVIAEDPDVIIAVPHANPEDVPALTEYLRSNPAWASTKAARTGRIHVSVDNSLLQAGTDIARVIKTVRRSYLGN